MPSVPAIARRLARECLLLKRSGTQLAALWGGPGLIPAPAGPYRHWISVGCSFLPEGVLPQSGVLSVYTNEKDRDSGIAVHQSGIALASQPGEPLYAHSALSLPPPDADQSLDTAEYMSIWQSNCPIYTQEAVAVLGGWHFPWPDDDWEQLQAQTLVLCTIENSEPWVEVWQGADGLDVMLRIT